MGARQFASSAARAAWGQFRSKNEARLVPPLLERGAEYEPGSLAFEVERRYTPDVVLANGVVIEIKGNLVASDRAKLLSIKGRYPALDLRMVLEGPNRPIYKGAKTTRAQWCQQHDIPYAEGVVPEHWVTAKPNGFSLAVLDAHLRRKKVAA